MCVPLFPNKDQTILTGSQLEDWIAYNLMDSIVDAFFPLIDLIEAEFRDISAFLADPLKEADQSASSLYHRPPGRRKVSVTKRRFFFSLPVIRRPALPEFLIIRLPSWLIKPRTSIRVQQLVLDDKGNLVASEESPVPVPSTKSRQSFRASQRPGRRMAKLINRNIPFSPAEVLHRMAQSRKLVVGILRLIASKTDVTRALRKRSAATDDIAIYFGDLEGKLVLHSYLKVCQLMNAVTTDHILTMQQSLNFYDVILAHDHPLLVGLLRLTLRVSRLSNDRVH